MSKSYQYHYGDCVEDKYVEIKLIKNNEVLFFQSII